MWIASAHEEGTVVIRIRDDGRGISTDKVVQRAKERGIIGPDDVISEARAVSLIFEPGFSTAETVSDLSGRGVGLDVVRQNLEALNGSVNVQNQPGGGSVFTIRLPLTLAIIDGLSLGCGEQVFVLPLLSIVQSFRATPVKSGVCHRDKRL